MSIAQTRPALARPDRVASPFTERGWQPQSALSYEEWAAWGPTLGAFERAVQWALGDWLNYGERQYGERYSQAMDDTGLEYGTLANCAYVAGRFDVSRRRETLSWSHHAEVAGQPPETADMLLDWCEREHWSRSQLRAVLAEAREAPDLTLLPMPVPVAGEQSPPAPEWAERAAALPRVPVVAAAPTVDGPAPRLSLVGPARAECPPLLSVGLEVASVSRLVGVLWRRADGGAGTFLLPEALMADCGPLEVGGRYRLVVTEEGAG